MLRVEHDLGWATRPIERQGHRWNGARLLDERDDLPSSAGRHPGGHHEYSHHEYSHHEYSHHEYSHHEYSHHEYSHHEYSHHEYSHHEYSHHEYSHHQDDPDKLQALADIGRWEVSMLGHLLTRMQSTVEADGSTMLDNALVFFSSEIQDGNSHSHEELPIVLAGKGGGLVAAGQHVRADNAEVGDVLLTMLKSIGVEQASFGEYGTRVLDEILA